MKLHYVVVVEAAGLAHNRMFLVVPAGTRLLYS